MWHHSDLHAGVDRRFAEEIAVGGHRHPVQLFHCLLACRSKCGRHDIPALGSAEDPWDRGGGFWDVEEQELPVHRIQMPILA